LASPPLTSPARTTLQLAGLHCAACGGLIERALRGVEGVSDCRVNAAAQSANILWDPARTALDRLVQAVRRAGYDAAPATPAAARELRRRESRSALWGLFVAVFCMMQVMMLAAPHYVARPGELAPDLKQLLDWAAWVLTLPVMWWSAAPFFRGAWRGLRARSIGMDLPVALGLAVAFVASTGAAFQPTGPFGREVYFDSLTMFVSFLLAGRWLQMRLRHRAAEVLESGLAALPATAFRLRPDGGIDTVPLAALQPGDCLQVAAGASFPADGVILQGHTQADEALLSGESRPLDKPAGAAVLAASLNLGAPVLMRVDRCGADTHLERIVGLMHEALAQRPPVALAADRWATPFLAGVLLLAAGAAAAWSVVDPPRALWVAVSVLVVTCPCALSLAAPSAYIAAAQALARRGVLLRQPAVLDVLARIDTVFLDKTGTLTGERPTLAAVARIAPSVHREDELLARAASLARWSTHPLSQALAAAVPAAPQGPSWREVAEQAGLGLSARDDAGLEWRLGSARWLGIDDGAADPAAGPRLWFGPAGRPLLRLDLDEQLRPDAAAAVDALHQAGLQTVLLSGDTPARARRLAEALHLQRALGGADPARKLDELRAAQSAGRCVAMVGDGINDAPVLAQADVAFAMGHAALAARSAAGAVLVDGNLKGIAAAHHLALRTRRVVRQNFAWAALYNAASIPLALAGALPPWAAGLGMALSSLAVIGNSLRLAR